MPTSRTTAKRDDNRVRVLIGVSSKTTGNFVTGVTPVPVAVNPITKRVILTAG